MTRETLLEAFIFLDTTRAELGPIERPAGIQYLRTEGGFNDENATLAFNAWTSTYALDGCAEDRVDAFLSAEYRYANPTGGTPHLTKHETVSPARTTHDQRPTAAGGAARALGMAPLRFANGRNPIIAIIRLNALAERSHSPFGFT